MMMTALKRMAGTAVALGALAVAPLAQAGLITFDIKWSNGRGIDTAFAELTLDSLLIDTTPTVPHAIDMGQIAGLKLTVSGATVGNGVFGKQDFSSILFYARAPVDFTRELIGQRVVVGTDPRDSTTYGDADGISGGFGFLAKEMTTPSVVRPFAMVTDRTVSNADFLTVRSILARRSVAAVPEPASWAMLLGGLVLVTAGVRRKHRK